MRAAVLALLLGLTACTTSHPEEPSGGPRRDLAARPESLPPDAPGASASRSGPAASGSGAPGTAGPTASGGSGGPASGGSTVSPGGSATRAPSAPPASSAPAPGTFHQVGTINDTRADAGAGVPGYADLAVVTVEDDGTNARVTVTMAATVPAELPDDETMGVGVDLYRTAAQVESDYQLFADGEPDGWFAYLQTPKGFVRYPGTFGVGGRRLVFTVPWSALGGPRSGGFSAFADWTRDTIPANQSGEDHAPNLGNATYRR